MKFLKDSFKLEKGKVMTGEEREKALRQDQSISLVSAIMLTGIGIGVILHNLNIFRFSGDMLGILSFVLIMLMCAYVFFTGSKAFMLTPNDEYERRSEDRAAAKAYSALTLGLFGALVLQDYVQKLSWLGVVCIIWGISLIVQYRELKKSNG